MIYRVTGTIGGNKAWVEWQNGALRASDAAALFMAQDEFRRADAEGREVGAPTGPYRSRRHLRDGLASLFILTDYLFDPIGQTLSGDVPTRPVDPDPNVVHN